MSLNISTPEASFGYARLCHLTRKSLKLLYLDDALDPQYIPVITTCSFASTSSVHTHTIASTNVLSAPVTELAQFATMAKDADELRLGCHLEHLQCC